VFCIEQTLQKECQYRPVLHYYWEITVVDYAYCYTVVEKLTNCFCFHVTYYSNQTNALQLILTLHEFSQAKPSSFR